MITTEQRENLAEEGKVLREIIAQIEPVLIVLGKQLEKYASETTDAPYSGSKSAVAKSMSATLKSLTDGTLELGGFAAYCENPW